MQSGSKPQRSNFLTQSWAWRCKSPQLRYDIKEIKHYI